MIEKTNVSGKPTILIVDDTPDNLMLLNQSLKDHYTVLIANRGAKALKIVTDGSRPDIILLDIMMPEMDGYEVLKQLKADPATAAIPVIFLTAKTSVEDEQYGLDLGAADYIAKPISPPIVLARVRTQLAMKAAKDFLEDKNHYLEEEVRRRVKEIGVVQDVTIIALASLAETRDNETGLHIRRTQNYVRTLAFQLRKKSRFTEYLSYETIDMLYKSAPLHDIGKVGVPDRILLKPGRFSPEEFEIMKRHTTIGRDAINNAEGLLDSSDSFLSIAREIAYSHHEKWDGSGYPQHLTGEAIPVSARLMAIADVYDALISKRIYKDPMPHDRAVSIIKEGRGSHFDPDMVDAFLEGSSDFHEIAIQFADNDSTLSGKKEQHYLAL